MSRKDSYSVNALRNGSIGQEEALLQLLAEKRDGEQLLRNIAPEYLGIYVVDRETDRFRDIIAPDFFREIVGEYKGCYSKAIKTYRDRFVAEECWGIIDYALDYEEIYAQLKREGKVDLSYHKKDGTNVQIKIRPYSDRADEAQLSIWFYAMEMLADQNKEYTRQKLLSEALAAAQRSNDALRKALEESEIRNEVIASIGKTYQYISRVDLQNNYYEELTGGEAFHVGTKNRKGNPGDNARLMCEKRVAPAYQEGFLRFTDMSTLPERIGNAEYIEYEYRLKDGNWDIMRFIVKKRDAQGRVTHVLCVIRCISDSKKKEQSLVKQAEEASTEARFLSNMSHDIRTPMNGILGMLDLAEHYPDDPEMQQRCHRKIREISNYMLSMLNDVLDMNKLQTEGLEEPIMTFNFADMLRKANEDAERKAAEKNISYIVDWGKGSHEHQYFIGNPLYTMRILGNLADNAIKFSPRGSSIRVWCQEHPVDAENSIYEFGIQDHGIGMSKEFLNQAFDMFSQENAGSRTNYEGTGLGLAIVKKMLDKMHGTIEMQSEKGVGTTAVVRIPFRIGEKMDEALETDYENVPLNGMRVLLAEDNELNAEIACFILEDNGLMTEWAKDGVEALEMFKKSGPGYYNAVLMDIMMPRMNGMDAARQIRLLQRRDAESVPIIAMSANAFSEDIIGSRLAGMDMHLAKPVEEKKLLDAIRRCTALHNQIMTMRKI